jgi:hypothetical protein
MKKTRLLPLLILLLLPTRLLAQEYGHFDLSKVMEVSEKGGQFHAEISFSYLDRVLQDLQSHAMDYPPRFDSVKDRKRAEADVRKLDLMLGVVLKQEGSPDLLWRAAQLSTMAYALDMPGAAQRAEVLFAQLLDLKPKDGRAEYRFGLFLASKGEQERAKMHLEKALTLGMMEAEFSLGQVLRGMGQHDEAQRYLNHYHITHPDDERVAGLLSSPVVTNTSAGASKKS